MLLLWLATGVLTGAGSAVIVEPSPSYAGGYGALSSQRRLTPEEDAALDRALFGLEDSLRKARTPRVRRKKLASAAQYAETASAIIATIPMAAQPLDLSPIREALALIMAGQSAFQDWRADLIRQAHDARLELQVMQAMREEEEAAMFMLLAA